MENLNFEHSPVALTKGQKTAQKILEAAARCIASIGAEKTSITAIAEEANLKRSLIAYHFPKKDDIFYKVMAHIMMQFGRTFLKDRAESKKKDLNEREELLELVEAYMDYFQEYPHYFHCYLHCFYMASVHERYKVLNTKIMSRIIIRIQSHLRKLVRAQGLTVSKYYTEDFSKVIYSNLLGTIMSYYTVVQHKNYADYKKNCFYILNEEIDMFLLRGPLKK